MSGSTSIIRIGRKITLRSVPVKFASQDSHDNFAPSSTSRDINERSSTLRVSKNSLQSFHRFILWLIINYIGTTWYDPYHNQSNSWNCILNLRATRDVTRKWIRSSSCFIESDRLKDHKWRKKWRSIYFWSEKTWHIRTMWFIIRIRIWY